jgi:adenylylsulfate kinase
MLKVAGWIVRRDAQAIVILDGRPFAKKYQVDQVIAFAVWIQTPWKIIECVCPEEVARGRLENATHPAADRDFALYRRVKAEWEQIERPKLTVRTQPPAEDLVAKVIAYIRGSEAGHPSARADR